MGKMYTLKPGESINDHVKKSISLLNRLAKIVKEAYKYLPEKDCTLETGVFLDIDSRAFYSAIEHARESIEMLDELCDEQDEDNSRLRSSLEKLTGECPYHEKYCDYDDCGECEYARISVLRNMSENCEHFRELAISRNKELEEERERSNQLEHQLKEEHERYMKLHEAKEHSPAYWKEQFERMQEKSNQLEEKNRKLTTKFELAKKFLYQRRAEYSRLKEKLRQTQLVKEAQKKVIDEKEKQISDSHHEIWKLQKKITDQNGYDITSGYPKTMINNPANFCGNCKYFATHPNDVGMCENIYGRYSKAVDPDDTSCQAFESNNSIVIDKPEFPCCDHCNHEDCDDCTLCPF